MKMFKQLLAIVAMTAHGTAFAAVAASSPSSVLPGSTYSYATFNNGDVVFRLSSGGLSGCYGFWLRATDPGFKSEVASLLAVLQPKRLSPSMPTVRKSERVRHRHTVSCI